MAKFCGPCGLLLAVALAAAGCGSTAQDPRVPTWRSQIVLDSEPEGAVSVLDLRESLTAEGAARKADSVTLVGQIGGVTNPWGRGEAAFVVAEPSMLVEGDGHAHSPDHDAASCPFCSKHANPTESLAMVKFVDQAGQVLPIDARELLGVQAAQTVVVRGQAELDALGNLLISAHSLYIRK